MKKKMDDDMPQGKLNKIADFLPSPAELVIPEDNIKITILLNKKSVAFFKKQAKKNNTRYQRMIRSLLESYARHYA